MTTGAGDETCRHAGTEQGFPAVGDGIQDVQQKFVAERHVPAGAQHPLIDDLPEEAESSFIRRRQAGGLQLLDMLETPFRHGSCPSTFRASFPGFQQVIDIAPRRGMAVCAP